MIGTFTALLAFHTARTPTGRIAGPLTPPLPNPSAGFLDSTSITSPGIVFTSVSPSAPESTASRAVSAIEERVGESFTKRGFDVTPLARLIKAERIDGSAP